MDQTRRKQQVQLEIFEEFKRVCEELNISYFAIGGTCIGAIRHAGFIPWDDDIDVAMFMEDYYCFLERGPELLGDRYSLYLPQDHPSFESDFVKLQDNSTTEVSAGERGNIDQYMGINIDIMPVYGMPKGKLRQVIRMYACDLLMILNRRLRMPERKQRRATFRIIHIMLSRIIRDDKASVFIKMKKTYLTTIPSNESDKVLFGWRLKPSVFRENYTYKSVFFYDDFKSTIDVQFENTIMKIPVGYDRYLKMDFGDYMQLPPMEKRVPSHRGDILDFEQPYSSYIKDFFDE